MLKTLPGPGQVTAARILKPGRILDRLRPVKLETVAKNLWPTGYQYQALKLIETHFPDLLPSLDSRLDHWTDTFRELLTQIEAADWFEVDWDWLNDLWQMWMQSGEEGHQHDFAAYLTGLPVRCYGFTEYDRERYPALAVLSRLYDEDNTCSIDPDILIDLEIYDALAETTNEERRIQAINTDYSVYAEPLCWLADFVQVAAGKTGNLLLDTTLDPVDWWPDQFTWAQDLERVRDAWPEAKPVARRLARFKEWLDKGDEEMAVRMIVDILLN